MPTLRIFFLFVLVFVVGTLSAQKKGDATPADSTKTYKLEISDGSTLIGNILKQDSVTVVLKTSSIPRIEIPVTKITRIDEVAVVAGKKDPYWFTNPNATRYLFGPSAFNLNKGEGYYQNTYLVLNSFNVGITNNFSLGAGFELLSTFGSISSGEFTPIFFVTPKVGFEVAKKFHLGGGLLYVSVPGIMSDNRTSVGIGYAIGTYGTLDHNITGGLGWGFADGEVSDAPIITLSGMTRISRKAALVTENWFVPIDGIQGIYSYGLRFFGEKIAVDLAFLNNAEIFEDIFIGVPYIDFTVKF